MSKHWNPDSQSACWTGADDIAPRAKVGWPEGATAGVVLIAVCCLGLGVVLYQVAGPRDVVQEDVGRR